MTKKQINTLSLIIKTVAIILLIAGINLDKNSGILQNFTIVSYGIFKKAKFVSFTNLGRKGAEYMLPDLRKYFSDEEIKSSYLLEDRKPNSLLKNTNCIGKKYIIVFTSKENVKKFEKYDFKVIGNGNHRVFGDEYCMRKENDF